MDTSHLFQSLAGGLLIGASASLLLAGSGRIAGISGITGGLFRQGDAAEERPWRLWFLAGLLGGGVLVRVLWPEQLGVPEGTSFPVLVAAGLLVGVGTQLGNGCTSGHGVCGLARGSKRSLTATLTFMGLAGVTVFVVRHVLGGVL